MTTTKRTQRKNITSIPIPEYTSLPVKRKETRQEWYNRKFRDSIYDTQLCESTGFLYGECKSLKQQLGTRIENIFNVRDLVPCLGTNADNVRYLIKEAKQKCEMINYIHENMTIFGDRPGMYVITYIVKYTNYFKEGEHNSIVYHEGAKGGEWYYYDKKDALWHADGKETAHATIRSRLVSATQGILRVLTEYIKKIIAQLSIPHNKETSIRDKYNMLSKELSAAKRNNDNKQCEKLEMEMEKLNEAKELNNEEYCALHVLMTDVLPAIKKDHIKIRKDYASTSSKNLEMTGLSIYLNDPDFPKKLWDTTNNCLAIRGNMVIEYKLKCEGDSNPGVRIRPRVLTDYCLWEMPVSYPRDTGRADDRFFTTTLDGCRVAKRGKWIEMVETFMWSPDGNEHLTKIEYFTDSIALAMMGKNLATQAVILSGIGRNGKSGITRVLQKTTGRYFVNIPYTILSDKKGNTNFDIIGLKGARIGHIDEMGKAEEKISSATLKRLVQDDGTITCRGLFKDNETFAILATLVLTCNKFPELDEPDTDGTIRRIGGADCISVFGDVHDPANGKFIADTSLQGKIDDTFLQEVLVWLVASMQRLCEMDTITIKNTGTKLQKELETGKNSTKQGVQDFVDTCLELCPENDNNIVNTELLSLFQTYCTGKGVQDYFGIFKNTTDRGAKTTILKRHILDHCTIDGQEIPRWTVNNKGFMSKGKYAFYMVKAKENKELDAIKGGNDLIYYFKGKNYNESLTKFLDYLHTVCDEHTDQVLMKMIEARGGINNFISVPVAEIKPVRTTVRKNTKKEKMPPLTFLS